MGCIEDIRTRLFELQDDAYGQLQRRIVNNIDGDTIIGVRTPQLRALAKEMAKEETIDEFLADLPHRYYEENQIHFFIISAYKDFDECISAVDRFLPYIDNWAVCDQSSPKVFKKNHDKLLKTLTVWLESDHVYTKRFAIRMYMNEFLTEDFKVEYLDIISQIKSEDYYLKMMVAWYFATALAKQYEATLPFIEKHVLEPWTHKKAIQKAVESYRVSAEHKIYLKTLR